MRKKRTTRAQWPDGNPGLNIHSPEELTSVLLSARFSTDRRDNRKFFQWIDRAIHHLGVKRDHAFSLVEQAIDHGIGEQGEFDLPQDCLNVIPGTVAGNFLVRRDIPEAFFRRFFDWALDRSLPEELDQSQLCGKGKSQGYRPTCLAHACCRSMEALKACTGHRGMDFSEEHFYWACKERDDIPDSSGTTLRASEDSALEEGFIEEHYWPYRPYRDSSLDEGHGPPPDTARRAPRHFPAEVINLPSWLSPEEFLLAIRTLLSGLRGDPRACGIIPVLTMPVYPSMSAARHRGNVPTPLPGERPLGYHAINVTGYDRHAGIVIADNSWGDWSGNPRGAHRLNFREEFFEQADCYLQVLLSEPDLDFLRRFEGGVPEKEHAEEIHVYHDTDAEENDMKPEPHVAYPVRHEKATVGSFSLLALALAVLPLLSMVWVTGTLRVLATQWWGNLLSTGLVFGLALGCSMLGTSRLIVGLVPVAALATAVSLFLGLFLTGGWLIFGSALALAGVAILVFLTGSVIQTIFVEAGRRLRWLIEESPVLMAADSLVAIFFVVLALVLIVHVVPPLPVHYSDGIRVIVDEVQRLFV